MKCLQFCKTQYYNKSYWIFLKMFHIHLNIQRLNIGGFRGDEMDLLDNLDSFHPSMSELEALRLHRKKCQQS